MHLFSVCGWKSSWAKELLEMGKAAGVRIGGFVEVFVLRVFVVRLDLLACLLRICVSP